MTVSSSVKNITTAPIGSRSSARLPSLTGVVVEEKSPQRALVPYPNPIQKNTVAASQAKGRAIEHIQKLKKQRDDS